MMVLIFDYVFDEGGDRNVILVMKMTPINIVVSCSDRYDLHGTKLVAQHAARGHVTLKAHA